MPVSLDPGHGNAGKRRPDCGRAGGRCDARDLPGFEHPAVGDPQWTKGGQLGAWAGDGCGRSSWRRRRRIYCCRSRRRWNASWGSSPRVAREVAEVAEDIRRDFRKLREGGTHTGLMR